MTERQSHSIRNAVWAVLFTFITTIMGFVIRTLLIKQIGAEYLGLSSLCQSILGTLNLAELGMDTALSYNLYKPYAVGDKERINALLALYQKV
ncbi:MAG: polysaccharide biosynthesis protein, partial [Treponema sp.]|nr:polysaccharide biosynthesis protein [Treponema sp.]